MIIEREVEIEELNLLVDGKPIGPTVYAGLKVLAEIDTEYGFWTIMEAWMPTHKPAEYRLDTQSMEQVLHSPAVDDVEEISGNKDYNLLLAAAEAWLDKNESFSEEAMEPSYRDPNRSKYLSAAQLGVS